MRAVAATPLRIVAMGSVLLAVGSADAGAQPAAHRHPRASPARRAQPGPARAPTGPSLLAPSQAAGNAVSDQAAGESRPEADPLVSNGLGSPACKSPLGAELGVAGRRDCETSGFTAAAAPTGNFGLDVHIDTGLIPLSGGSLLSTVQDLFVTPVWLALVWLVHVLVVMLEWCFGLDLLDGASAASLQSTLSRAGAGLTAPLLALALAIAGSLTAYHGLIRRRVGQTLGEALAMLAMFAAGTWLMLDPAGTVGSLSSWSSEAGLGTLAVAARGAPDSPGRTLAQSMRAVFAAAIEMPWCFLEFGNVNWCREPERLDHGLRAAAVRLARRELHEAHCTGPGQCERAGANSFVNSARLLREGRTNGDEFLALPPNGPERNSINDTGSLLRAVCRSSDATSCVGQSAGEAEFRTNSGTWPRLGGLVLIVLGLLGMILLLGYIGLRLLLAAILSVFYLLLVPGIVLVPALGEQGRRLFRAWAIRLLSAVTAKLVFAFLLGVTLAVMAVLDGLEGLGWWTQWMLLSAFWWGAFLKRHELLAGPWRSELSGELAAHFVKQVRRRHEERAEERRDARNRRNREGDGIEGRRSPSPGGTLEPRVGPQHDRQPQKAEQLALHDQQARRLIRATRPLGREEKRAALLGLAAGRAQLGRIARDRAAAMAGGDRRRAARLDVRRARVERDVRSDTAGLARAETAAAVRSDRGSLESELRRSAALLDRQAELPGLLERRAGQQPRDYAALAGLLGMSHDRYRMLDHGGRRAARLEIDRELSARRRERGLRRADPDSSLGQPRRRREESPVMRDAREVAEGRKQELGFGRP
jgi:hypothetical protein